MGKLLITGERSVESSTTPRSCCRHGVGVVILSMLAFADVSVVSYAIRIECDVGAPVSLSDGREGRKKENCYDHAKTSKKKFFSTNCGNSGDNSCSWKDRFAVFSPLKASTVPKSSKGIDIFKARGGHSHSHGHSHHSSDNTGRFDVGDQHAHHHEPPYGIPLHGWKMIFQFLLTSVNILSWYVPLNHKSLRENELGMSIANSFSGGVFLSLAFGHLIPECVAGFPQGNYSEVMPFMFILGGYMLIFFVEKVAFDTHGFLDHGHGHSHSHEHHSLNNGNVKDNQSLREHSSTPSNSGRSAIILLGALGVHSVLEMVSLGLSNSFVDSAVLSLSIGLHQPAESVALLVAFLKSGLPVSTIVKYLTAFSILGPIGTGIGMAVKEYASPLIDAIMLAIVAGTFVYVGATEVIPEEFEDQTNKWLKFAALISGIFTIFAITQCTHALGWS